MKTSAIILLMCFGISALAHEPNSILYNLATSGLYLRSKPDVNSRVITKIPYGTKVVVKATTGIKFSIGWIEDEWLEVEFRGRLGYVFAGYLSHLSAPEKKQTITLLSRSLVNYAERAFLAQKQAIESEEDGALYCY